MKKYLKNDFSFTWLLFMIKVQSLYVSLVSVYFILSMLCTFFALAWFSAQNYLITKGYLPIWLEKVAKLIKTLLCCLYSPKIVTVNKNANSSVNQDEQIALSSCNKCEMCSKCKEIEEKVKKKKEEIAKINKDILVINYLILVIIFTALFLLHIIVWISSIVSQNF